MGWYNRVPSRRAGVEIYLLLGGLMPENSLPHWPREYAAAALLLLQAAELAEAAGRSPWDFAVELEDLRRSGLSRADLRWLICRGWLDHAAEISAAGHRERVFQPTGG